VTMQLRDAQADLEWDGAVDLTQFEVLDDDDRMRVIIRVLCGLVALEEEDWFHTETSPRPRRQRLLPYLGYERSAHLLNT